MKAWGVRTYTIEVRRAPTTGGVQTVVDIMRGNKHGPPASRWHVQVLLYRAR